MECCDNYDEANQVKKGNLYNIPLYTLLLIVINNRTLINEVWLSV